MLITLYFVLLVVAFCDCDVEVTFKLYTPEKGIHLPAVLSINNSANAVFAQRNFKILCHGWTANSSATWYKKTIEEYLKTKRVNIIAADYGKAVDSIIYLPAVWNIKAIGENIGKLCISLNVVRKVMFNNFHIIGHSLGAHIAGIAGETVLAKTGNKLGRITGLDPASILFNQDATQNQISKDDGLFVDVIHTSNVIAFSSTVGQVDFYPNGGTNQPGCKENDIGCFHTIAPTFFYKSILKYNFVSTKCAGYKEYLNKQCSDGETTLMGERVKIGSIEKYFLITPPEIGEEFYLDPPFTCCF